MIRKLLLGAAVAVAIGFGVQTASAAPPIVVQPSVNGGYLPGGAYHPPRVDFDYIVMVERRGCWEQYGRFDTFDEARRVERRLEHHGLRARIEEVRDHRHW